VKSNQTGFVLLEFIFTNDNENGYNEKDVIWFESSEKKWISIVDKLCKIENIDILERGLDTLSMCNVINKALNDALGWDLGIVPNIAFTHNSDHITKDEQGVEYLITVTGNVVVIDDEKTNYLLYIRTPWIQKVKEIPYINRYEFQM
ncbi:2767_t:CDS:2, partial [Diversispora eburnea]